MAVVTAPLLKALETAFKADFQGALTNAPSQFKDIAVVIKSATASNTYGWLGNMPKLREWIGDRSVENIMTSAYAIMNKKFESTISLRRTDIEDDNLGIYTPLMQELGREAGVFPDIKIFELLGNAHNTPCYDGQSFFDADHPVYEKVDGTGTVKMVSNMTEGQNPATDVPWFLLDCSRALKPLIYQERTAPELTAKTALTDEAVFHQDAFLWGTRIRSNVGFGFWQMAHRSTMPLEPESLWTAISAMRAVTGDGDKKLGIRPTHIVVPASLEKEAVRMLERELNQNASNELKGRLKLIVADYL